MAPTKSTPAKETPTETTPPAVQDPNETAPEPQQDQEPEPQKTSTKAVSAGDHLWVRGDSGPMFALVTAGGEGEADVLLLRPDEVIRGRTVEVFDSADDAERAYDEGRTLVAWHL